MENQATFMHYGAGRSLIDSGEDISAMQDQDVVREFLVESHENLSSLDQKFVELEKHPKDAALLASIFRTIHTIKGTCGFLGIPRWSESLTRPRPY